MATYTLRPNADWANASYATINGGAATRWGAISDNSDTTYLSSLFSFTTVGYEAEFGTQTLGATESVSYVNVRVRMAHTSSTTKSAFQLGVITDPVARTVAWSPAINKAGSLSLSTVDLGLNLTSAPSGTAWDQTAVDRIVVRFLQVAVGLQVYEAYVDVVTTTKPTVTVTAPTGTITDTSFPTVSWTYADADSVPQSAYQVKVFDSATYSLGSFSPATSIASVDTGIVATTDSGVTLSSDLANSTNYRAYTRVAKTVNGSYYWSDWAYSAFDLDLSAPADPVVSAYYDSASTSVTVSVIGRTNFLSSNQASFETDTTGWGAETNCSIARTTSQASAGAASMSMTAVGAGTMSAATTSGTKFAVTSNVAHSARAEFRAQSATRSCRVGIQWLTAAGATISTSYGSIVTNSTSGWTTATVTANSPVTAAYGRVFVEVQSAGAAEVHYVDKVAFHPGLPAVWSVGGYYGHSFVVERSTDGSTWSAVRGSPVSASTGQTATIVDYEAPIATTVTYRAKARAYL